jgi:hypothetical protein
MSASFDREAGELFCFGNVWRHDARERKEFRSSESEKPRRRSGHLLRSRRPPDQRPAPASFLPQTVARLQQRSPPSATFPSSLRRRLDREQSVRPALADVAADLMFGAKYAGRVLKRDRRQRRRRKTTERAIVLMSATIPAPPEGSSPAIVSTGFVIKSPCIHWSSVTFHERTVGASVSRELFNRRRGGHGPQFDRRL